jgi:hypothetical protein
MPATITTPKTGTKTAATKAPRTTKAAPAKGADKTAAKKAPAKPAVKAEPKAKFVAPPKPDVEPTSLKQADYGYTDDKGRFRFWQGYDAKFKKNLMNAARVLPVTATAKQARETLVANGWSTEEREQAVIDLLQQKADRKVAAIKAKAEREKAKKDEAKAKAQAKAAQVKKTKPEAKTEEAPAVETTPEPVGVEEAPAEA